jgi:hypothetical protein
VLNLRTSEVKRQGLIGLALFGLAIWLAWEIGNRIIVGDLRTLELACLGFGGCIAGITVLRNWRFGFYLFFIWMLFEDLVRKYMGNGAFLFFGKDILLALIYISFYAQVRRGREKWLRAPFLFFLSLFFWLGVLQVFNPYSPHILYGLLGLKVYFYYVPLMYVGYALFRSDEDLRKFLVVNEVLAAVIASVGIVQGIHGNRFLNPAHLAPELEDLGNLHRYAPIGGQMFNAPDSVFVSNGRFDEYLTIAFVIAFGAAGYFLLSGRRRRALGFVAITTVAMATLLSGSRGTVMWLLISALALSAGLLWGAPWRWRQAHRLVRAIRHSLIVATLGLAAVILIFPDAAGSRIAFYAQTLLPGSSSYALADRTWDYPIDNFLYAFSEPHWAVGNGIGTASLGTQYVAKLLDQRSTGLGVEEGFGDMIVEMGLLAPLLWLLWAGALLYYSWKVVSRLRETRFFPLAIVVFWYAFFLLYAQTYGSIVAYQNYVCNIYLWLLLGMLYRLPDVLASSVSPALDPMQSATGRVG